MLRALRLLLPALWLPALLACRPPAAAAPPLQPEELTPVQLTLPRLGGGTLSLEALRGRPVVVTLFTTWCFPCQAEAPTFQRLHERFGPRGLTVLGVAMNAGGARPVELVKIYVEDAGLRFPILYAAPDDLELIGAFGKTPQIPRTLLLDRKGRVVLDQIGETRFLALEAKILELLGRP